MRLRCSFYQAGDLTGGDRNRLLEITAAGAAALPASSHTRNAHGYALLGAGRYEEAAREFEAYARIAPREPNPHDSLGEAYLKAGDAGESGGRLCARAGGRSDVPVFAQPSCVVARSCSGATTRRWPDRSIRPCSRR